MGAWPPVVVVIEPDRELAVALQEVVTLARCRPMTMPVDDVEQLASPPAAIVVRMATRMPLAPASPRLKSADGSAPRVLALASNDTDVAEAERLGADVILREPHQVRALYDALVDIAGGRTGHSRTDGEG
jgi:hypothetical protein